MGDFSGVGTPEIQFSKVLEHIPCPPCLPHISFRVKLANGDGKVVYNL